MNHLARAYILWAEMILTLHIIGAVGFLVAVAGSIFSLFNQKVSRTTMANALIVTVALQVVSGIALVVFSSASLGRVCAMSLIMAVVALPLRQRLLATA